MNITSCPRCGRLYEEASEEQANSPNRCCLDCFNRALDIAQADLEKLEWERYNAETTTNKPSENPNRH